MAEVLLEDLDRRVFDVPVLLEERADVDDLVRVRRPADYCHELVVRWAIRLAAVPPVPGHDTAHRYPVSLFLTDDAELVVRHGDVGGGEGVGEAAGCQKQKHEHGRDPLCGTIVYKKPPKVKPKLKHY